MMEFTAGKDLGIYTLTNTCDKNVRKEVFYVTTIHEVKSISNRPVVGNLWTRPNCWPFSNFSWAAGYMVLKIARSRGFIFPEAFRLTLVKGIVRIKNVELRPLIKREKRNNF